MPCYLTSSRGHRRVRETSDRTPIAVSVQSTRHLLTDRFSLKNLIVYPWVGGGEALEAALARSSVGERAEALLSERLQARRAEIEQAVLTRVYAVSDPTEVMDPVYADGLRSSVSAAVAYGVAGVEQRDEAQPPPHLLLTQARLAARHGVGLDTVLRRYFAGHALLGDFLIEEAAQGGVKDDALRRVLRTQATHFDRLLAAVSVEHSREAERRLGGGSEERRGRQIERLLAGELLDTSALAYDFEGSHLAAIASGPGAAKALGGLVETLDCRLLLVHRSEETVWAWLGSRRRSDPAELEELVASLWPADVALSVGEPADGLAGWRLSHQQARAALPLALRSSEPLVRYSKVALLASVLQDELLVGALDQFYLAPLKCGRDGGVSARETLRAYFAADRNTSSAAAALGVSRHTVTSRLRTIEESLGRPLNACAPEIEIALRLRELDDPVLPPGY